MTTERTSGGTASLAKLLDRLERRMESGFAESHQMFSKIMDRIESGERAADKRFAELESKQAASGRILPSSVMSGTIAIIGLVLAMVAPLSGLIYMATENRVLQSELQAQQRLVQVETVLGLMARK
jgi:hypothetical protein